jgi:predicted dehydrogenase
MSELLTRRRFLQHSAALAGAAALTRSLPAAEKKAPPSERLNLGIIGVNGRGAENLAGVESENIVALCDVDLDRAGPARDRYPHARFYQDFRRLLDQKNIDAVVISIPDHMHAFVAVPAMRAGKHVYCEKPLAHSVSEVRLMMATAARHKLVTQMGTQIHAGNNYRRAVEIVQSGAIGPVSRVQVWCEKRPNPVRRKKTPPPVPKGLDYELWLGPAPYRPYDPAHLHFDWRWWWDFGGGILADMACHYMDVAHWALGLRTPTTVIATGKKVTDYDYDVPDVLQADFEYPARGDQPAVHLTWYSGVPGPDLNGKLIHTGYRSGVLFEGEKGQLLVDYTKHKLLPEDKFRDYQPPKPSIPASIGHHREWLEAVKHGGTTTCNFAYSGALAETVLLGNVAFRSGEKIHWDNKAGRVTNAPEAERFIHREYRKGWTL